MEAIGQWKRSETSTVFWLHGSAGTGKSTVAHTVARDAHAEKLLGGIFLCKRDAPAQRDVARIIPTLAWQLARACKPYKELLVEALKENSGLASAPLSTQFEGLLGSPLKKLKGDIMPNFIVVIDALDECFPEGDRLSLIEKLCSLKGSASWLKFCMTSRPSEDIQGVFKEPISIEGVTPLNINDAVGTGKDIEKYLEACLDTLVKHGKLKVEKRPTPKQQSLLVQRASGLFIWVRTMYRFLDSTLLGVDNGLEAVINNDRSENAEEGLHTLYHTVFPPESSKSSKDKERLQNVLGVVIAASKHQNLTVEGIAKLSGESEATVISVYNALQSVLIAPDLEKKGWPHSKIQVYHPSFLDFMEKRQPEEDYQEENYCPDAYSYKSEQINELMAVRALVVLISQLKFNICSLDSSYVANKDVLDLSERIQSNLPSSLQYSCLYWVDHLEASETTTNEQYDVVENMLLSPKALYWIEVLSLLDKVPLVVHAMDTLQTMCQVCALCHSTCCQLTYGLGNQ